MKLIIAEKPSLARDIATALPMRAQRHDTYIECGEYIVTWLFGHMLTLKAPEDYDKKYKKWSIDMLPIYFEDWQTKTAADKTKRDKVKQIGEWLQEAEEVIHAGDPDEEGQLLVDEILRLYRYQGKVSRLDTGNTTEAALKKAFNRMTDNREHENAGWSAYARSVADLMIGVNMSRFFTCSNTGTLLTVGRVQTPTLGLVVKRDYEIENHIKRKYYNVYANTALCGKEVVTKFVPAKDNPETEEGKIYNPVYAQRVAKALIGREYTAKVEKKTIHESPPLPFNLVKLQSYCGKKFNYSPSEVLRITQSLRENHKAITYNRSDCQYLSEEHYKEAPDTVRQVIENISYTPPKLDIKIKSRCFNDANITAHFAIIPTNNRVDLNRLTQQEKDVYLAVCKFYLIQFMPKAIKEKTELKIELGHGNMLTASSTVIKEPGYLLVYREGLKNEQTPLSEVPSGEHHSKILATEIKEEETKPPSRYTKTTLNEDMTRIAKYVDNPTIKKMLLEKDKDKKGENGSIGTSATRSGIIDKLVERGFLKEEGKKLISTPLGRELCRILPTELTKPDMTAQWWAIQEEITSGQKTHRDLTHNVLDAINAILNREYPKVDNKIIAAVNTKEPLGKCPRCGGDVIEGKLGFGCVNYKEPIKCGFTIWKKSKSPLFSKMTVSANMVKKWLSGKPVRSKRLYSPKKNKTFEADVLLKDNPNNPYGAEFEIRFIDKVNKKGKKDNGENTGN